MSILNYSFNEGILPTNIGGPPLHFESIIGGKKNKIKKRKSNKKSKKNKYKKNRRTRRKN